MYYCQVMPTVRIGPYKVPIKFVAKVQVDGEPAFGSYCDDPHTIEIERSLKERPEQLCNIVLHECLEAIDAIYAVGLQHSQIEVLSTALTETLRGSKYLRERLAS